MALVLPIQTSPPTSPTSRRHVPRPAPANKRGYEVYRPCLRWEFGFTCAFCLLHESQVAPRGARRSGLFWIEHRELQSDREDLINDYDNVIYTCRWCNLARGEAPIRSPEGRSLLDPCAASWSEHFRMHRDSLEGTTPDGVYTQETYDLNSPQKASLRAARRRAIEEALALLRDGPGLMTELLLGLATLSPERLEKRISLLELLRRDMRRARADLHAYSAIPADSDNSCRCDADGQRELPAWLVQQCMELESARGG